MTLVNVETFIQSNGSPAAASGSVKITYWAGYKPVTEINGDAVIAPEGFTVTFTNGTPGGAINLIPSVSSCVRWDFVIGGTKLDPIYTMIPNVASIDIDDLEIVDPHTLTPSGDALSSWSAVLAEVQKLRDEAVAASESLQPGEPDGVATLDSDGRLEESQVPSRLSETALNAAYGEQFNPMFYGATGDGVADDTEYVIAAVRAAEANGGGVVVIDHDFLCNTTTTFTAESGASIAVVIPIVGDNVEFRFVGGHGILSTADAYTVVALGSAKQGIALTSDNDYLNRELIEIAPAARYDSSITCVTPADAAAFNPGDKIYIRTGQTVAGSLIEPDAEMNEVLSTDTGTGVVKLVRPLAKSYAQEYFISGSTGKTSTSVTAQPAQFGIANVTDMTIQSLTLAGVGYIKNVVGGQQLIHLRQVEGLYIEEGITLTARRHVISGRNFRDVTIARPRLKRENIPNGIGTGWWFAASTGCGDIVFDARCFASPTADDASVSQIHLHEGLYRVTVDGDLVQHAQNSDASSSVVSVRARAYDVRIADTLRVVNGGGGAAIAIDDSSSGGGHVGAFGISGSPFTTACLVEAPGWSIGRIRGDYSKLVGTTSTAPGSSLGIQGIESVSQWVRFDNQTVDIGGIPQFVFVTNVRVHVYSPFNSDGTDTLTVGHPGNASGYAASVDVSTTGLKTVTFGPRAGFNDAARLAQGFYTPGGSQPTTGRALVTIEYYRVPRPA